jgi:hypothetical protein
VYEIDLLTVLAPGEVLRREALDALRDQGEVRLQHHFAPGRRLVEETRAQTIARARNAVKAEGSAPLALFLDRDVVLPPGALEALAAVLTADPQYGALGIDYGPPQSRPAAHVGMGAVMFPRAVLERITFRAEPGRCECQCCCDDLRQLGYRIDYLDGFRAGHVKLPLPF